MEILNNKIYFPSIRAGKFDMLAFQDLSPTNKELIVPVFSLRGSNTNCFERFITTWGATPLFVDVSRFEADSRDTVVTTLNSALNNFTQKSNYLLSVKAINENIYPVIGFYSGDSPRAVTQFALNMLLNFDVVALRIEGKFGNLDNNLAIARSVLNAVSDNDLARIVLIADLWFIDDMPSFQQQGTVPKILKLVEDYPQIRHVVTLSTSWPENRPSSGSNRLIPCLDPFWQAYIHADLNEKGINCYYGDYAATNPVTDRLDYIPGMNPIPFAGYFTPFEWYQERLGAGGENIRFRDIAQNIRVLPNYHGDPFCWGTTEIFNISQGAKTTSGNISHWNRIRINQHISAMLEQLLNGGLSRILNDSLDDDDLDEIE